MLEHLPIVGIIARRIHERRPQHVSIEDLYSLAPDILTRPVVRHRVPNTDGFREANFVGIQAWS
jgi:hypothetical protein